MMLATNAGTFLKAARSVSISSGICCVAITSMVIANANAASMKVSSRVIAMPRNRKGSKTVTGSVRCDSCSTEGRDFPMAEASSELEGPDLEKGYETENVREGEMLLGHAFGEPVLVARRG